MPAWVTEKKPPLLLSLLVVLQLFTSGLLGALMLYQALSAGTNASGYLLTSGLTMFVMTIVIGLPGLFFIRRSTNLLGGGGIILFLQIFYGYWSFSGPDTAFAILGSDGTSLNSSFFTIGFLSQAITITIVLLRVFKEDRDYVSKLWNFGPALLLTIFLRSPVLYSSLKVFQQLNTGYGIQWPFGPSWFSVPGIPIIMLIITIHWIQQIIWFLIYHIAIFILRTYQERILALLDTGIASNFYNVLPTLIILFLVMGASLLESFQFGATRHRIITEDFVPEFEGGTFIVPDWEYDLGNLLDQLTAGLQFPDQPLFYITTVNQYDPNTGNEVPVSDTKEPLSYWWRKEVYTKYGYKLNPNITVNFGRSNWDKIPLDYRLFGSTTYGQEPYGKNATYQVEYLAAKSENDDSWEGFIPATWNGRYGSYIPSMSDPVDSLVQETTIDGANINYEDSLGVWAQASVETGTTQSTLTYNTDFRFNPSDVILASLGSGFREENNYLTAIEEGFNVDSSTALIIWNTIKQAYLQLPGSSAGTLPASETSYASWAPLTNTTAYQLNNSALSVYQQAVQTMNYIAPDPDSVQSGLEEYSSGNYDTEPIEEPGEDEPFQYDWKAWLLASVGSTTEAPDADEDYVEWFLNRRKGIAAHFATALTVLLRMQKIPARFVYGYLVGNTTMDPTRVVMTARWQHAWTEVLMPIYDAISGESHVEWVIFDPLFAALYPEFGGGKNRVILNPFTLSDDQLLLNDTVPISISRIGIAEPNIADPSNPNPYVNVSDIDNYPVLSADYSGGGYLANAKDPIIKNDGSGTPTNVNVSVAVADIKLIAYNDPIFGSLTIFSDPVFVPNIKVLFFMYKQTGTGENTTDQLVPLFPNGSLFANLTTNSNGIASFIFPYDLSQGFGAFRIEASITLKNAQGEDVIISTSTDANPFNAPLTPDPFTLAFGTPMAMAYLQSKKIVTREEPGILTDSAVLENFVKKMADDFKRKMDDTIDGIVTYTSNLVVTPEEDLFSIDKNENSEKAVEVVVTRSIFESLALVTSEEGSLRAITFLRRSQAC